MALKTRLTEMLNIKHPIMLAGMGGVSYAEVCAAMCNAGGYGVLGMAGTTPDFIAGQMKRVRELTDRPFGVDLLAASPESLEESVDVIINGGADSFVAGLGVPMPIMERLKKGECEGHGRRRRGEARDQGRTGRLRRCDPARRRRRWTHGLVGTLPLVAQAVEAVKIPVSLQGVSMTAAASRQPWRWAHKASGWARASSLRKKPTPPTCTRTTIVGARRHRYDPHALLLRQADALPHE
jgi:enoyl-[acyl-carrier protein] reductase II